MLESIRTCGLQLERIHLTSGLRIWTGLRGLGAGLLETWTAFLIKLTMKKVNDAKKHANNWREFGAFGLISCSKDSHLIKH